MEKVHEGKRREFAVRPWRAAWVRQRAAAREWAAQDSKNPRFPRGNRDRPDGRRRIRRTRDGAGGRLGARCGVGVRLTAVARAHGGAAAADRGDSDGRGLRAWPSDALSSVADSMDASATGAGGSLPGQPMIRPHARESLSAGRRPLLDRVSSEYRRAGRRHSGERSLATLAVSHPSFTGGVRWMPWPDPERQRTHHDPSAGVPG